MVKHGARGRLIDAVATPTLFKNPIFTFKKVLSLIFFIVHICPLKQKIWLKYEYIVKQVRQAGNSYYLVIFLY